MAGSIYLPILSSFNASGVNAAKQSLGGLATAFDGVKRALGLASASFVAFKAISETIDFGRSSIEAARDLERGLIGLDSVFGSMAPRMKAFGEGAVDIGLSQIEAAKASTFIGSVLKQAGFEMEDVTGQTQKLVSIASDLAFVYGYDVSEALSGITALFRGEYDPIEKFGVAMKQSEVNAVLAANGQDKLAGAARRNAEQIARLALFMERTRDAQGKFAGSSGSLYTEATKLQKLFTNMQTEVGKALIPALVGVAEALQPLVGTLAPAITGVFTEFAAIITILAGQLGNAQSGLNDLIQVFGFLFGILKAILPFLLENGLSIAAFIAVTKGIIVLTPIIQGLRVQFALLKMELAGGAAAATLFGTAFKVALGPLGIAAIAIGLVATALVNVATSADKVGSSYDVANKKQQAFYDSASQNMVGLAEAQAKYAANNPFTGPNMGFISSGAKAAPKVSSSLAAFLKAEAKARKEFVDGQPARDFQKMLDDVLKNFSGATTEIGKASGAATKKSSDSIKKAADAAEKAMQAEKKALAEFVANLKELSSAVMPLEDAGRDIGRFEQQVIDSMDAINASVRKAVADGVILAGAGDNLLRYVATESAALQEIGRQRDALAAKRSLVEALIADVKSAILGAGSLTSLMDTQTRTVTESMTRMVNGFVVTTRRTFEEVVGGSGIVSRLQTVLAKTRAFAAQLTQLKALGLNANLFRQIVEAGPDVGGQLATEILAGGAEAVGSLNETFSDLETVAGQVAEQTAVVMYNSGVEVAGGLVNGLLAQEAALASAARTLAQAFIDAFNALMATLTIPSMGQWGTNANGFAYSSDPMLGGTPESQFGSGTPWAQAVARNASTTNVNVTVNAGMGTNGKVVGQQIQSLLNQYARAN